MPHMHMARSNISERLANLRADEGLPQSSYHHYSEQHRRRKAALAGEKVDGLIQARDGRWLEPAAFVAQHKAGTEAASAPKANSSPTPAASTITATDVSVAKIMATNAERKRWADVFASEASQGRERGCVSLLSADRGWTAAQIVANLPHLPTDRENAAGSAAGRAHADDVWKKAYAGTGAADRVLAAQRKANGQEATAKPSRDVWADAYAANAAQRPAERILAAQAKAGGR